MSWASLTKLDITSRAFGSSRSGADGAELVFEWERSNKEGKGKVEADDGEKGQAGGVGWACGPDEGYTQFSVSVMDWDGSFGSASLLPTECHTPDLDLQFTNPTLTEEANVRIWVMGEAWSWVTLWASRSREKEELNQRKFGILLPNPISLNFLCPVLTSSFNEVSC